MQNDNREKHYLIYQITNLINGKIYVGKHIAQDINDEYMGSGKLIIKAINKYGRENFRKDILFECSSEDEMNKKEAEIVNEDFCSREDTYNIVTGGGGGYSNVVFYANRVLNEKLKNDPEFKKRFAKACSRCFSHASPEMKEKYREGSRKAGRKTKGKVYLYNDIEAKCIRV